MDCSLSPNNKEEEDVDSIPASPYSSNSSLGGFSNTDTADMTRTPLPHPFLNPLFQLQNVIERQTLSGLMGGDFASELTAEHHRNMRSLFSDVLNARTQSQTSDLGSTSEASPSSTVATAASSTTSPRSEVKTKERYKCHLCSFENYSSEELAKHMDTHFDHKCPFCDYTSRTEGRLKHHVKNFHSEIPPDTWAGSRVQNDSNGDLSDAGVNSDGGIDVDPSNCQKPRKHRCKQCNFVAMSKIEFWKHTETHIRPEKKLICPHCPFVTEYKHHLEYHLRNHLASKPFKCEKCNYACVNKSMLNSHLKSHSNIYQYRCDDCSYATKYCHSLKLHLRKYDHRPATVLNLDGTPNPYPIIDVYGTRRGPRPKKNKDNESAGKVDPLPSLILTSLSLAESAKKKIKDNQPESDEMDHSSQTSETPSNSPRECIGQSCRSSATSTTSTVTRAPTPKDPSPREKEKVRERQPKQHQDQLNEQQFPPFHPLAGIPPNLLNGMHNPMGLMPGVVPPGLQPGLIPTPMGHVGFFFIPFAGMFGNGMTGQQGMRLPLPSSSVTEVTDISGERGEEVNASSSVSQTTSHHSTVIPSPVAGRSSQVVSPLDLSNKKDCSPSDKSERSLNHAHHLPSTSSRRKGIAVRLLKDASFPS